MAVGRNEISGAQCRNGHIIRLSSNSENRVSMGDLGIWLRSASSDYIIALSLWEGGITFFDTITRDEIGFRIPTANHDCGYPIAFSPDGKWIVIQSDSTFTLDIWNVETRTHVKTIEIESQHSFQRITYSAEGEKVMPVVVTRRLPSDELLIFIWGVKTDKPIKQLEAEALDVAISPDGSQIATQDELRIKIIDVSSTGHINRQITLSKDSLWTRIGPYPRIAWSPNGQLLASATEAQSGTLL